MSFKKILFKIKYIFSKILIIGIKSGIKFVSYVNVDFYMTLNTHYLRHIGVKINGTPKFISSDIYIDGSDYSLVSFGDNIVISREVMLLTHDYSLTAGLAAVSLRKRRGEDEIYVLKPISIGNDCFIGARTSILPGISIGNNVIIGACSVVSKDIPDKCVAAGNPCRVLCDIKSWTNNKLDNENFLIEN